MGLPERRWVDADAYLFDIDGTLLNSRDRVHYLAFTEAMRQCFGVDTCIDGVPIHGNTDVGILRAVLCREGISDADIEAKMPELMRRMAAAVERDRAVLQPELCP